MSIYKCAYWRKDEKNCPPPSLASPQAVPFTLSPTRRCQWYNLGANGVSTRRNPSQASQRSLGFQSSPVLPSFFKDLLKAIMHFTWIRTGCYLAKAAHLKYEWQEILWSTPPPPTYCHFFGIKVLKEWGKGRLHTERFEKAWILLGRRKLETRSPTRV